MRPRRLEFFEVMPKAVGVPQGVRRTPEEGARAGALTQTINAKLRLYVPRCRVRPSTTTADQVLGRVLTQPDGKD